MWDYLQSLRMFMKVDMNTRLYFLQTTNIYSWSKLGIHLLDVYTLIGENMFQLVS